MEKTGIFFIFYASIAELLAGETIFMFVFINFLYIQKL